MRFFVCLVVIACLACPLGCAQEMDAALPSVSARGAILIERESGRVLYEENADQMMPMASITKVMTALLTIEHCDLGEVVTVSRNASGVPGTSIYLAPGEQLTVQQLLYGLMLRSGNDAAIALAEHVAGDAGSFVKQMNDRAALLRADAHFENPHGLDEDGHMASARGMALVANEAMDHPAFRDIVSTTQVTIPWSGNPYDRALTNKNKLLTTYTGALGIKTGFTNRAGRCLIFAAERDGMEVLGVVLNCGQWFDAAAALMDWGFERYEPRPFLRVNQEVDRAEVTNGMADSVAIVSPRSLGVPVRTDESARLVIETHTRLEAPIYAGSQVGRASVVIDGEEVAEQALVAGETVEARNYANAFWRIVHLFNPLA